MGKFRWILPSLFMLHFSSVCEDWRTCTNFPGVWVRVSSCAIAARGQRMMFFRRSRKLNFNKSCVRGWRSSWFAYKAGLPSARKTYGTLHDFLDRGEVDKVIGWFRSSRGSEITFAFLWIGLFVDTSAVGSLLGSSRCWCYRRLSYRQDYEYVYNRRM
jgi:hypothetical protein